MLIGIMFVDSICRNDVHEDVRGMAEDAMEELEKQNAIMKYEAEAFI